MDLKFWLKTQDCPSVAAGPSIHPSAPSEMRSAEISISRDVGSSERGREIQESVTRSQSVDSDYGQRNHLHPPTCYSYSDVYGLFSSS